jgi:hypothetical protein
LAGSVCGRHDFPLATALTRENRYVCGGGRYVEEA